MAIKYLRSAAAGAGTGADWTNAYTTLAAAFTGSSAGDTIYVADDHAETQGSAMTLTSPGTASSPVRVICANTHVTTPPTAVASSATISTTGSFAISINPSTTSNGFAYFYGIAFSAGSGSTTTVNINVCTSNAGASALWFDTCKFILATTGASSRITVGYAGSTRGEYVEWINTSVQFANAGQAVLSGGCKFIWRNTAPAVVAGSTPTVLLFPAGPQGAVELSGLDLSLLGSGKSLVSSGAFAPGRVYIRNCKLGSSVSAINATILDAGTLEVYLDNCDSGSINYRMEHYKYQGSIAHEIVKVKAGGASDGTTPISHKFVSLAGASLFSPLAGPWMAAWNDTTGSSKTLTVDFLHDANLNSGNPLTNADVYLDVEYLGSSATPICSTDFSTRVADVFASTSAHATSAASWTTTGMTTPTAQKIQMTFTPQMKGPVRARVCLVKASYSVYVDPVLQIT